MPMSPHAFTITGTIKTLDDLHELLACIAVDDGGRNQNLDGDDEVLDLIEEASAGNKPLTMSDDAVSYECYGATRRQCVDAGLSYCESWEDDRGDKIKERQSFWTPGMSRPAGSVVEIRHDEMIVSLLSRPLKEAVGRRVKLYAHAPDRFPSAFHCPPELIAEARANPAPNL